MIGTQICITDRLAYAVGKLAGVNRNQSLTIAWDDENAEQIWTVTLHGEGLDEQVYLIDDQSGEIVGERTNK